MQLKVKHLFLSLELELVALCLIASFHFINIQSTITLLMFTLLFASLIYQLNGTASRKLGLLAVGNIVGLFWNMVFLYFSSAGTLTFGKAFDTAYTLIYPILNLMWIVPFWALSLSVLPKFQSTHVEVKI